MEVKKYNPFVVMNKSKSKPKTKPKTESKPTGSACERSSKTKLEARGLSLENKKKLDTIYAKGFVNTSRK